MQEKAVLKSKRNSYAYAPFYPTIPHIRENKCENSRQIEHLYYPSVRKFASRREKTAQSFKFVHYQLTFLLSLKIKMDNIMSHLVAPSLLSANFLNLEKDIEMLNRSEADWIHLDIMDGVFVPNISFGFPIINRLKEKTNKPLDVHLMIVQPEKFVSEIAAAGAYMMNVHYEACTHLHRVIGEIKNHGMKAGVTLNPHTPVLLLEDIIKDLDMVLLMSVNPGFGGQKFIEHSVEKVTALKNLILQKNVQTLIEVDGGVNLETGKRLVDAGADVLVAGNFVFASEDPVRTIRELKSL